MPNLSVRFFYNHIEIPFYGSFMQYSISSVFFFQLNKSFGKVSKLNLSLKRCSARMEPFEFL